MYICPLSVPLNFFAAAYDLTVAAAQSLRLWLVEQTKKFSDTFRPGRATTRGFCQEFGASHRRTLARQVHLQVQQEICLLVQPHWSSEDEGGLHRHQLYLRILPSPRSTPSCCLAPSPSSARSSSWRSSQFSPTGTGSSNRCLVACIWPIARFIQLLPESIRKNAWRMFNNIVEL